ncbi:MAG: thiamine pyrophosphate-binding protein [Spirochaetia bacterium]|nr:thiamine pyrophosphate-binding protein [Spirochaetia bacterium]
MHSDERNIQIVLKLLKAHNVRRIIISPGATNISFVGSVQDDSFFTLYSAVDERSAAYIACGMAAETGETIALSCTGATASRNYMPALTEAFYRKLPILVLTSSQFEGNIGNMVPQVTDRSCPPKDTVKYSVNLPIITDAKLEWMCTLRANRAFLEINNGSPGPVHINIETCFSRVFTNEPISPVRIISKHNVKSLNYPILNSKRVAIFIGNHARFSVKETDLIESFCDKYNAVAFCDNTSNYMGAHRVNYSLACYQEGDDVIKDTLPEILIHLGEISGDYPSMNIARNTEVWRVDSKGEICDPFHKLTRVFEMTVEDFFAIYSESMPDNSQIVCPSYQEECQEILKQLYSKIPELPFSNIWIAFRTIAQLPPHSSMHFGILNSLRSWNLFSLPDTVEGYCNTGGFGIDGILSSAIGASLAKPDKLVFCVLGDLAFFYDMNSLANRHIGNNLRIMLINNGCGTEFKNYCHTGYLFKEKTDAYIAASGHNGNKSHSLVKHFAEDLGFQYLSANNKEEFNMIIPQFLSLEIRSQPIIVEVFTNSEDESNALYAMNHLVISQKRIIKTFIKNIIGK